MQDEPTQLSSGSSSMFEEKTISRREFMEKLAIGGGALVLLAGCASWKLPAIGDEKEKIYSFIAVDYTQCTGCRTCEAVCAASNHSLFRDGRFQSELGNPIVSNIRVHSFNPDVDVPIVCARCKDTPCVNVCPVEPDPETGRRALFQETALGIIANDPSRCIGCGSCVDACKESSVGILMQHPETSRPMRMCTLCNGDPQCVAHCPYNALSVLRVSADYPFYRMSPVEIAEEMNRRWYV